MDWMRLFFGRSKAEGTVSSEIHPHPITIAKGRGYTTNIVGEANYQSALAKIAGPKTQAGKKFEAIAELTFDDRNTHDPNAISVSVNGQIVGFIDRGEAEAMRASIRTLNPERARMRCHAKIVGGWRSDDGDEGHYGVKLAISNPMRRQ
jgi:hypothetical protein